MSLLAYVLKRIGEAVPLILGIVTIVFFLARLLPGNVTDAFISPAIPESVRAHLRVQLGLDRPVVEQYFFWISSVLSGDFGYSFTKNAPVLEVICSVFPNTVVLGIAALFIEIVASVLLTIPTFLAEDSWFEKVLSNVILVVYSLPSFWIGVMLLVMLSYSSGIFPSSQMYSSGQTAALGDMLAHLVLPALTAAIPATAGLARYLRSSVSSVMKQEYVLNAWSMGLSRWRVFRSYVLKNSAGTALSVLGVEIGILLSGVLVTETLFSWPGMGRLTVDAIFSRDYPLILGCTLVSGIVVIMANLLSDVVILFVDPRRRRTA